MIQFGHNSILGLDVGSSAVKMVQLRKEGAGYSVISAGVSEIAEAANQRDMDINAITAISECRNLAGIQSRSAVCSVCGPEVAVRGFSFPPLQPDEIEGAVQFEAEQVCPFSKEQGRVDYQVLSADENKIDGILVAATNELINRKVRKIEDASLNCVLMDVDGLALLNCFEKIENNEPAKVVAILNVGSSCTDLVIGSGDGVPFVRNIAYAGEEIIKQIAVLSSTSSLVVKEALAESENAMGNRSEFGEHMAQACQGLLKDIKDTLRYYCSKEKSAAVSEIYVCGGFAQASGFVEVLDEQLSVKAVLWNPFSKMRCNGNRKCRDIVKKRGPALAVAAGLAMREI